VEIAFRGTDRLIITGGIKPGEQLVITDLAAPVAGMLLSTADDTAVQAATRQTAMQEDQS